MNVEIFGSRLSDKVVEVSMSMRRKTGTMPWKTIAAAAAVSAAFVWIIVGAAAWNKVDFYFRSGADDAADSIGDVLQWSDAVHSAHGLYSCGAALDEVFSSNERGKNQTGRFDLAKLHKISADVAYEYREQKIQLLKIPDDTDVGYRSDVLMLHELLVKWLELVTVNFDIYVNAETFYKQHPDSNMRDEYYRRYCLENKDREFKYPDSNKRTQEYENISAALQRTAYWCMREHGGYMLYRGCSSAEVRSDLTGFAKLINERLRGDLKPALADAEFRCLELRFKNGSSFASFWYPIRKTIQEKYFLYELRKREKNNSDFTASPQPVNNRIIVRSREDKLWNTANYLACARIIFCGP